MKVQAEPHLNDDNVSRILRLYVEATEFKEERMLAAMFRVCSEGGVISIAIGDEEDVVDYELEGGGTF